MRANLRAIAQAANNDPKAALLRAAGPMTDYEVFHNNVLVATNIRPEKTKGGIILTDKSLSEDRFQGKVGLVIAVGPIAFVDDAQAKFGGVKIAVGDWVIYRPSDGYELFIKDWSGDRKDDGISCRLLEDSVIKGRVSDPSLVY